MYQKRDSLALKHAERVCTVHSMGLSLKTQVVATLGFCLVFAVSAHATINITSYGLAGNYDGKVQIEEDDGDKHGDDLNVEAVQQSTGVPYILINPLKVTWDDTRDVKVNDVTIGGGRAQGGGDAFATNLRGTTGEAIFKTGFGGEYVSSLAKGGDMEDNLLAVEIAVNLDVLQQTTISGASFTLEIPAGQPTFEDSNNTTTGLVVIWGNLNEPQNATTVISTVNYSSDAQVITYHLPDITWDAGTGYEILGQWVFEAPNLSLTSSGTSVEWDPKIKFAIPEPGTYTLLLGLASVLVLMRRRK